MNFTEHPSNNVRLGAPVGWDHTSVKVDTLPATRTEIEGHPVIVSYWQPSADELAAIAAGQPVALVVWGSTMPPVAVAVAQ